MSTRTKAIGVLALTVGLAWLLFLRPGGNEPDPATAAPPPAATTPSVTAPAARPSVTVTVTTTPTASPSVAPSRPVAAPRVTPSARTAQAAAERFVAAWMDTTGGRAAWLARVQPLTGRDMADGLALTDLAQLPKGRIEGSQTTFAQGRDAQVAVRTSSGTFAVTLYGTGGTWSVWGIAPLQASE